MQYTGSEESGIYSISTERLIMGELESNGRITRSVEGSSASSGDKATAHLDSWSSKIEIGGGLSELFAENVVAKVLRVAAKYAKTQNPPGYGSQRGYNLDPRGPDTFPEYIPQDGDKPGQYTLREAEFWTCGFFPGTIYLLLERHSKLSKHNHQSSDHLMEDPQVLNAAYDRLSIFAKHWAEPLYAMAKRTDTHDIGFIIMPALRLDWELNRNQRSLDAIVEAGGSLASRFITSAGVIRSWDLLRKKDIEILDMEKNVIVIIDSLCNLDLLYYAAKHGGEESAYLADIATRHASKLLETHLRPETLQDGYGPTYGGGWFSTYHVGILDPTLGDLKRYLTAQGYADESTWARGQAWGIYGYAQTYRWTRDDRFLLASCGLAEYFLYRLNLTPTSLGIQHNNNNYPGWDSHNPGRVPFVPPWDFDAPQDISHPILDSSAGVIAANGLLMLSESLAPRGRNDLASWFLKAAIAIVRETLQYALAREKALLVPSSPYGVGVEDVIPNETFEGLLKYGTANNNANARKRYYNHGLVYGDYYLVEFGNRLLRMGLVRD
ncbi:unsaturated glucuronyl hydrolase [Xylaria acuta]|nr:unsaturated glucuronyl hydrolase [Xylaria acuta]